LKVEITITGSHLDGFTAAELWCITTDEEHFIGRVFEQEDDPGVIGDVLEGTHLFQTSTHTDVVRLLRD